MEHLKHCKAAIKLLTKLAKQLKFDFCSVLTILSEFISNQKQWRQNTNIEPFQVECIKTYVLVLLVSLYLDALSA